MSSLRPEEIASLLEKEIQNFDQPVDMEQVGSVIRVGDGIALVYGLHKAMAGELLKFPGDVQGVVLNLEVNSVGVALMGPDTHIREGDLVRCTGNVAAVPVGPGLIGRVVDPLGRPLDGGPEVDTHGLTLPLERKAPDVLSRQPVKEPLMTGLKAIDSMIPIGRGQRELIIGDRGTGKTAVGVDAIINQKGKGVWCIYVAVGQKASSVAAVVERLKEHGAMDHTIVVMATAEQPASLQYIAPYTGCAMGEYFRDKGEHALCIYDDLSKHAAAYRQMSLLLRRPPGREAYPGDVFYLHSRLLERAAKLMEKRIIVKKGAPENTKEGVDGKFYEREEGKKEAAEALEKRADKDQLEIRRFSGTGGSLTALPVIETQAGDVSAYIPTNVISITDGQIYLEPDLFYAGIKPAINVGLSVSRVGGNAQTKAMKQVGGRLRLDLAQYRELAAFAQFGADLDAATQAQLTRGEHMVEVLKQDQYKPMPLWKQIVIIQAGTAGLLDELPVQDLPQFETMLLDHIEKEQPQIAEDIQLTKLLKEETARRLEKVINEVKEKFAKSGKHVDDHGVGEHPKYPGKHDHEAPLTKHSLEKE